MINTHVYKRLEIFSDLEEEATKASLNREKRANRRNGIGLTINLFQNPLQAVFQGLRCLYL
jgi:hypothetical protein